MEPIPLPAEDLVPTEKLLNVRLFQFAVVLQFFGESLFEIGIT